MCLRNDSDWVYSQTSFQASSRDGKGNSSVKDSNDYWSTGGEERERPGRATAGQAQSSLHRNGFRFWLAGRPRLHCAGVCSWKNGPRAACGKVVGGRRSSAAGKHAAVLEAAHEQGSFTAT